MALGTVDRHQLIGRHGDLRKSLIAERQPPGFLAPVAGLLEQMALLLDLYEVSIDLSSGDPEFPRQVITIISRLDNALSMRMSHSAWLGLRSPPFFLVVLPAMPPPEQAVIDRTT